jgi:RNA polymerase sigma-70 factor (ECF subfamily)
MANTAAINSREIEFERTMLVHLDTLYNSALRLTGNAVDADDLVQETFLKAYRFFHRFRKDSNSLAWLFKIMKNSYINRFRQKSREPVTLPETSRPGEENRPFEPGDMTNNPEEEFLNRLLHDEVEQAIRSLPDEFKLVVLLSDVEGLKYKEIADILSCPIGTVRSRLSRGRRLLQRQLWDYAKAHGYINKDAMYEV